MGAVGLLRKLKVLNLQNNRIRELPDELALLTELRDLVLSFNSLLELPPAGVGKRGGGGLAVGIAPPCACT